MIFRLLLLLLITVGHANGQRFVQTVPTIAEAVRLNPRSLHTHVNVLGYNSVNDGGGGIFSFVNTVTSTNKGMRLAMSTPGWSLDREYDGEVNVLWFGATGKGVVDDTAAIQAAIDFAETPSHGPAVGSTDAASAAVYAPRGRYNITTLIIKTLPLLYGDGDPNADLNRGTLFYQLAGTVGPAIRLSDSTGITYNKPTIRDLYILGRAEQNATGHKAITAVTDRLTFTVAVGDLPTYHANSANFPWFGHCFFYSSVNNYIGSGWVTNINYGTGEITLRPNTDWYATRAANGLLLSTQEKVIFSPLATNSVPGFADWIGYSGTLATAGNTAIEVNGSGVVKLHGVTIEKFHVGILNRQYAVPRPMAHSYIKRSQFANIAAVRPGVGPSDAQYNNNYLDGYYRWDYDLATPSITLTNEAYRHTVFNVFCPGFTEKWTGNVLDGAVMGIYHHSSFDIDWGNILLDNQTVGAYWLEGTGQPTNAFRASTMTIRSRFLSKPGLGEAAFPLNSTNEIAAITMNSLRADASIGMLSIRKVYATMDNAGVTPVGLFPSAISLAANNTLQVAMLEDITGATNYRSGANTPLVSGFFSPVTTATNIFTGPYSPSSTVRAYAVGGKEILSMASTGATIGESTLGSALTLKGNASGVSLLRFQRPAVADADFGLYASTDTIGFYDFTDSRFLFQIFNGATYNQLSSGSASATPRYLQITTEGGLGTDIAGGELRLLGGIGTGAGTPGVVKIITTDAAASSATPQSVFRTAAQFDSTTTAGQTRFLLYDVDNGTLERVSVGAADSGGAGFKVLRIPN